MTKRAAIYIRVSSEMQAEKASPVEQERDCRAYAEAKGYRVVEVYRDVERYRVKGRLVEPSGTRTDRPGLLRMLADAERGVFDVAIAWREDRLYRGLRAMLNVLDLVEAGKLDIELVKENFDRRMAPIKASIAKMELEGLRERTTMGMQSRLRAGKPFGGERLPYPAKFSVYRCARVTATPSPITHPDCPRTKGVVGLDRYVWGKVSNILRQPQVLIEAADAKSRELKANHAEASKRRAALEARLEALREERQALSKFGLDAAKGGPFTEADLDAVLERLTAEEAEAKRDLAEVKVLGDSRIAELKPLVATYLADISSGLPWLDRDPENEQDAAE